MINNHKQELRKRPTYDEMLKQAITSKLKTTVILKKYKKGMLLNNFDFDELDLMNYKNKERYMNAEVMMADKATQTLNKENKATQTDLPNDKATQTYNFDDMTKILGGSSKKFKSKLMNKAEAEALAFTYDPDLNDDDDDNDDDDKKDDDNDKYRKKLFMLMRIIDLMLRSGFSIGQIVAHLTYHTTLTTIQGSELLVNLTMNSLVSSYDIASAIMNWLNTNVSEEVELNTEPPVSVHSSPPITVNSSSTHTVHSSSRSSRASGEASSEENSNYEIAPPTDIPVPTGVDGDESESENDETENQNTDPAKTKKT